MDAQEQKMLAMMQEMLASQAESLRLLTEQIAEKDRINKALEQRVAELSAQVAWLQRQLFGRKSEKMPLMDPNLMSLFDEPIAPEIVQRVIPDLGIVKYHFEVAAGKENFEWINCNID